MTTPTINLFSAYLRTGIIPNPSTIPGEKTINEKYTLAAVAELASLGFLVDPYDLHDYSVENLNDLISAARAVVGTDRFSGEPMYVNFPDQVKNMKTIDLIIDQIVHYLSRGKLVPAQNKTIRPGLSLHDAITNAKRITRRSNEELYGDLYSLVVRPVAMDTTERTSVRLLAYLLDLDDTEIDELIKESNNNENAQVLVAALHDIGYDLVPTIEGIHNPDLLLRVVLSCYAKDNGADSEAYDRAVNQLSDKDHFSLKMVSAPKRVRRAIVKSLGNSVRPKGFSADALVTRRNLWQRVMRMIHPFSLNLTDRQKYACDVIHENIDYQTFNSVVEEAFADGDVDRLIATLQYRPGVLLRRVVALSRLDGYTRDHARKVAEIISCSHAALTTLVSAYNGVINANDNSARIIRTKHGNSVVDRDAATAKYTGVVSKAILEAISVVLYTRKAPKAPVGINGTVPVPLAVRDASESDRQLYRGEIIKEFNDDDVLRLFLHWVNNGDRGYYSTTDIDLGVNGYTNDLKQLFAAYYGNYTNFRDILTFSGDIVDAPGPDGAAEYFDIDVPAIRRKYPDLRWLALSATVYSGSAFKDIDHISGVMTRDDADRGEIFDPRTVVASGSSVSNSRTVTTLVVDLAENVIFWVDSGVGSLSLYTNAATQGDDITAVIRTELLSDKLSVGELAELWADAHGVATTDDPVDMDLIESLL